MAPSIKSNYLILFIFSAVVVATSAHAVVADKREASFMPPPGLKIEAGEAMRPGEKSVDDELKDLSKPPAFDPKEEVKKEAKKKVKKASKPLALKAEKETEPLIKQVKPVREIAEEEIEKIEEVEVEEVPETLVEEPVNLGAPVAKALLADVDPETLGLLSPKQGGLGASLWKDASRALVDRLVPVIQLPTASYTLNDLARRMFLTTAAAPAPASEGSAPKRTLMAQRIEGLINLGAVDDAWRLFSLADPTLIDPITLTSLVEAAIIGPDSQKICNQVTDLMAAQSQDKDRQVEWQKALLICQLRDGNQDAVELTLSTMKEQGARRDVFMQLLERNVLGTKKRLPRHLTPLRPTVLALLRQTDRKLPSYLYKKPAAYLVPELVKANAQSTKSLILLAERSAAKGILTVEQLKEAYLSFAGSKTKSGGPEIERARLIAAALKETQPEKKVALIKRYVEALPSSYSVATSGKLAAEILSSVEKTSDLNSQAIFMAKSFALAGKIKRAAEWHNMAQELATRSREVGGKLDVEWPVFVLSGLVADGDYASGLKRWLVHTLKDGKDIHIQRDYAGRVLLLLSAAGYSVPELAWQAVVEIAPPEKQQVPSPVLVERMNQVAKAGRRGEAILLALLLQNGDPTLGVMTSTVRALRAAGLTSDMQALSREVLVGLAPHVAKKKRRR